MRSTNPNTPVAAGTVPGGSLGVGWGQDGLWPVTTDTSAAPGPRPARQHPHWAPLAPGTAGTRHAPPAPGFWLMEVVGAMPI